MGDDHSKSKVLAEKALCSQKISDLCRYIGFGLTVAVFTLFTSESEYAQKLVDADKYFLTCSGASGIVVIILDYLQFVGGYNLANAALVNDMHSFKYDANSFWYKLRNFCFKTKQVVTVFAAIVLLITLVLSIMP